IRFDMGSGNFSSPQDKDNHCMGNVVIIDHSASGRTGPFTLYAHLSQIDVQNGATPSAGDRIGLVGQTGYTALTPDRVVDCQPKGSPPHAHLHFELKDSPVLHNPTLAGQITPSDT